MKATAALTGIYSMTGFAQARVERDGSPRRIGMVAQYRMAGTFCLERTQHNHADNEEGLA